MLVLWSQMIDGARTNQPDGSPLDTPEKLRTWTADLMAASLAQQPNVFPEFRRVASSVSDESKGIKRLEQKSGESFKLGWCGLFLPWSRAAHVQEQSASSAELLNVVEGGSKWRRGAVEFGGAG